MLIYAGNDIHKLIYFTNMHRFYTKNLVIDLIEKLLPQYWLIYSACNTGVIFDL